MIQILSLSKPSLCFELELKLRNKERSQYNNKRWFYNSVEAVEREFYKKKIKLKNKSTKTIS